MMGSLRRRLLLWLFLGQLLAVAVAGVVTFDQVRREVDELVDNELRQLASSLQWATFSARPPAVATPAAETLQIQVWEGQRLLFDSHPRRDLSRRPVAGFSTYRWQDHSLRSFLLVSDRRAIQVTEDLDERLESALEVAIASLGPVLGLIPVLAVLGWFGVGFGMRPLARLAAGVARRRPDALAPLPVENQPREVQPLVRALNDLLARLGQALESQRKFVADAAHELRTPLTAVQLQAQVLERTRGESERREALQHIRAGTSRAAHLVRQLLTLARLEPESQQAPHSVVDLDALAREVVAEYAPLAVRAGIDLGVTSSERVTVVGDAGSLRVLLGNLVDNAIRYTPAAGRIDVAVCPLEAEAVLSVRDTGPGIPEAGRERVWDRFYRRPGSEGEGSGLGLAIVREVTARHGGHVALGEAEGGGLEVTVRFPRG